MKTSLYPVFPSPEQYYRQKPTRNEKNRHGGGVKTGSTNHGRNCQKMEDRWEPRRKGRVENRDGYFSSASASLVRTTRVLRFLITSTVRPISWKLETYSTITEIAHPAGQESGLADGRRGVPLRCVVEVRLVEGLLPVRRMVLHHWPTGLCRTLCQKQWTPLMASRWLVFIRSYHSYL